MSGGASAGATPAPGTGPHRRRAAGAGPAQIPLPRRVRHFLLIAGAALLALVAWSAPAAPAMAVGGFALALVLSFPVGLLGRYLPRTLAIAASFLLLAALLALAVSSAIPLLSDQLSALFASAPRLVGEAQEALRGLLEPLAERGLVPGDPDELLSGAAAAVTGRLRALVGALPGELFGLAGRTVQLALVALGSVVVAAYMLADARRIKAAYLRAAPKGWRRDALELWDSFGHTLSRYLSGLAFVMLIQGAISAFVLWLLGVPYALTLGAWVALTAVVPLVGAWVGAVPAVLVALSVSPAVAGATALLFLAIQQIEGNFLTPRVQGGILRVHPIVVLLTVVAAGQLAGPAGVLLAVPSLAVARVLTDFLRPRLRATGTTRAGGCP